MKAFLYRIMIMIAFLIFNPIISQAEIATYSVSCKVQKIDHQKNTITLTQDMIDHRGQLIHRNMTYQINSNSVVYGVIEGQTVEAIFLDESTYQPKLMVVVPKNN
jgi:Cu/Ag efflux protein CusF